MNPEEEKPVDQSRAAFSDKLDEFYEAIATLYIKKNSSGRIKFNEKWPVAAKYILGDELIGFDTDGVTADLLDRRSDLEEEAEDRRVDIKHTIVELKEKTSKAGVLQFEYVGEIIDKFGVSICQHFYTDTILERVRPGLLAKAQEEQKVLDDAAAEKEEADAQVVRDLGQAQHDEMMANNPEEQARYAQNPVPKGEESSEEMLEAVAPDASDDAKLTDIVVAEHAEDVPVVEAPMPPEKDVELASPTQDEAPKPAKLAQSGQAETPPPLDQKPSQTVEPKDIPVPEAKPIDTDPPKSSPAPTAEKAVSDSLKPQAETSQAGKADKKELPPKAQASEPAAPKKTSGKTSAPATASNKPEVGSLVKQFNLLAPVTEADPS